MNILFTSVGRRVELMRAFKNSLRNLGGQIWGTDVDPLAPAMHVVDNPVFVPRFTHPDYVPTLLDICRQFKIRAVFPLIDPDIPILAQQHEAFKAIGTELAVVSPSAAEICRDKWKTTSFFSELGLHVPKSWLPGERDSREIQYPVFIKPRGGSAAAYTFKAKDAAELEFFQRYVPDAIIQEFLAGDEITTDIVCGGAGEVLAIVSRKRLAVRGGEVVKGVTVIIPSVVAACHKIAAALPAVGPITAQCIMVGDSPHFIEINARLGGGIPLAIAAGVNVSDLIVRHLSGEKFETVSDYQCGLQMTRFDESFFIPPNSAKP
jgi:carbamoyl-phosphate synthase large subunit